MDGAWGLGPPGGRELPQPEMLASTREREAAANAGGARAGVTWWIFVTTDRRPAEPPSPPTAPPPVVICPHPSVRVQGQGPRFIDLHGSYIRANAWQRAFNTSWMNESQRFDTLQLPEYVCSLGRGLRPSTLLGRVQLK